MMRIVVVAGLLLASSTAAAWNWPWSDTPEDRLAWCKGFVTGGLAARQSADVYRTDLWLAWNYLVRSGAVDHSDDVAGYDAGRSQFTESMDVVAVRDLLDETDGSCGLGRSGRQATGW